MSSKIKVFYDGQCPLCSREIEYYQHQKGAEEIEWVDILSSSKSDFPKGLSQANALKRFHVLGPDGNLMSGGKGFVLLWSTLPNFSYLGKIFNNKLMGWILEFIYKLFILNRPWMQRLFSYYISSAKKN